MSALPVLTHPCPPSLAAIDALLRQQHADQRLVGAVVLVRQHGRLLHAAATGWADREQQRPMQRDAVFRLASVSKPIVTAAAMRLVAQGARAGVSDGMDANPVSLQDNVRRIAQVPLLFAPGEAWSYSLGVDVAGAMLEAVTGTPLAQVVREQVTAPLGMRDTGFHTTTPTRLATPYVSDTPQPHRLEEGEVVAPFDGTAGITYSLARATDPAAFASGGGGMVGTADDVMQLLEALRGDEHRHWLGAAQVAEMARAQVAEQGPPDPPGWGFGLGFAVLRDAAPTSNPQVTGSWRWGGAYGHNWFVDPARGLSVVALTNTLYEGMHGAFVDLLRDAVYAAVPA